MERVKKGEKYWFIDFSGMYVVDWLTEFYDEENTTHFLTKNYFHTEEAAESMAKKLRAVLNGADVIEMPNEKDAKIERERQLERFVFCGEEEEIEGLEYIYISGFADCLEYLKSKIIK